jgi:hypothetical protein
MFVCKVKGSKLSTGSPNLHMRLPSLCMQAFGLGYFTVWTNKAAGQSIHSDINLLMKLLAIWLSWQTTPTKPLVMRDSGAGSGGARAPGPRSGKLCVCSGRCAPASPVPKPLATISVAMYTNRLWLKTSPQGATAFPVKRKTLLNLRFIGFDHTRVCYAHQ